MRPIGWLRRASVTWPLLPRSGYLERCPAAISRRSVDSYLTQVSNRLGMATKTLGVVATVTLPILAGLKWRKLL